MHNIGQPERATQNRVIRLFKGRTALSLPRRLDAAVQLNDGSRVIGTGVLEEVIEP